MGWSRKIMETYARIVGEIFIADSILKTNPWTYKAKYLNGEKIIESFYEKELLQSIL